MSKVIPRFLYHLTSADNYKAIVESGVLRSGKGGDSFANGVFSVDFNNFLKFWNKNKDWSYKYPHLGRELFAETRGEDSSLVLLRIPTDCMDKSKLKLRSCNRSAKETKDVYQKYCRPFQELSNLEKFKLKMNILWKKYNPFHKYHCSHGASAKERRLYEQRKEAIEYIYPNSLSASKIQKVGEVSHQTSKRIYNEAVNYETKKDFSVEYIFKFGTREEINKLKTLTNDNDIFKLASEVYTKHAAEVKNSKYISHNIEEAKNREKEFRSYLQEYKADYCRDEIILKKTLEELCKGQPEEKAVLYVKW